MLLRLIPLHLLFLLMRTLVFKDGRATSCHSIESHSIDNIELEGGSGYVCRTSFKREVFIRYKF